jgi:hypothetical protein
MCGALDLDQADVLVLALDRGKLAAALSEALDVIPSATLGQAPSVFTIGRYAVAAGVACPVVLALPVPGVGLSDEDLDSAGLGGEPGVVLVATDRSVPPRAFGRLQAMGHQVLALSDALVVDDKDRLRAVHEAAVLLAATRKRLMARLKPAQGAPVWPTPPDAKWPELTFRLTSDETVRCSFRGETRDLDPDFFEMRRARGGTTTKSWSALRALAMGRGSAGISDLTQEDKIRKRFQLLGAELAKTFGIQPSPIRWDKDDRCYRAEFVISDERPQRVRRNFAGARRQD